MDLFYVASSTRASTSACSPPATPASSSTTTRPAPRWRSSTSYRTSPASSAPSPTSSTPATKRASRLLLHRAQLHRPRRTRRQRRSRSPATSIRIMTSARASSSSPPSITRSARTPSSGPTPRCSSSTTSMAASTTTFRRPRACPTASLPSPAIPARSTPFHFDRLGVRVPGDPGLALGRRGHRHQRRLRARLYPCHRHRLLHRPLRRPLRRAKLSPTPFSASLARRMRADDDCPSFQRRITHRRPSMDTIRVPGPPQMRSTKNRRISDLIFASRSTFSISNASCSLRMLHSAFPRRPHTEGGAAQLHRRR